MFVKDGIVTWEMQATDYPELEEGLPPYEPRGCQRGASFSWYLYSPLRVKYPYMRGALLDLWKAARREHEDPVDAWRALVSDPSILLADEPTGNLDSKRSQEIMVLLSQLNRERSITIVMITHEPDLIRDVVPRVVVFKDGKIVADGAPREVLA